MAIYFVFAIVYNRTMLIKNYRIFIKCHQRLPLTATTDLMKRTPGVARQKNMNLNPNNPVATFRIETISEFYIQDVCTRYYFCTITHQATNMNTYVAFLIYRFFRFEKNGIQSDFIVEQRSGTTQKSRFDIFSPIQISSRIYDSLTIDLCQVLKFSFMIPVLLPGFLDSHVDRMDNPHVFIIIIYKFTYSKRN